ncbi:MAG: beta-eliminating lyase-related protein [Coxiellaceae bacterium]|nr:beta-eliminating lyase-related protein [Coxiellaceae bacterium]
MQSTGKQHIKQLLNQAASCHQGWQTPLFDQGTYDRRLQTIQLDLQKKNIDHLIVSHMEDIYWLTNFETLGAPAIQILLVPAKGEVNLFTRELEQANALRTRLTPEQVDGYTDHQDPFEQLCRFFENHQLTPHCDHRIALQMKSDRLCALYQQQIQQHLAQARFEDASELITYRRQVKDDNEIAIMRQVAKITETTMQTMIDQLRPGINEHEVMAICHDTMFRAGSQYPAYPPFISFGESCALGHKTAEYKPLEPGDLGLLEIGPTIARYTVPMMRPIYCGEPPQWLDELTDCVNQVIDYIHSQIKPGAIPAEIDTVARQMISDRMGYFKLNYGIEVTQYARNGYMVGIGFMPDWGKESASIGPVDFEPLRENMTMHIIPWVQLWKDGKPFGALMLSDTARVTAQGGESFFSEIPRQLFCIPTTAAEPSNQSMSKSKFASDNAAGFAESLIQQFDIANQDHALGYGNDDYTQRIQQQLCHQFDCDAALFMPTGTAANKFALQYISNSTEAIFCSSLAHIYVDECGAIPNLVALTADYQGKIHAKQLREAIEFYRAASPHRQWPKLISLSQPTEMGYCYSDEELSLIKALANEFDMQLHMDGARLANACVATDKSLEQMAIGFDAVSFGATKNGTLGAEVVLLRHADLTKACRLQKQLGYFSSKPRYLAAQFDCLLQDARWHTHAQQANRMATKLATQLATIEGITIVRQVETNMVYAKLPKPLHDELKSAFDYLAIPHNENSVLARFVTAFNTSTNDIEHLIKHLCTITNSEQTASLIG